MFHGAIRQTHKIKLKSINTKKIKKTVFILRKCNSLNKKLNESMKKTELISVYDMVLDCISIYKNQFCSL